MSQECKKIKDLFEKKIGRELNGVIKVDQEDEENVFTELNEYVITRETRKNLDVFFNRFQEISEGSSDNIGVWVSGFFGSGKSHFIKILSYLLENKVVKDTPSIEFFRKKIEDASLIGIIEHIVKKCSTEVILFNIDSKSNKLTIGERKELIVSVMMRAFNEKRGYSGEVLWLADLEHDLDKKGVYEKFKSEFRRVNGGEWVDQRDGFAFIQDDIVEALISIGYQSKETCRHIFDRDRSNDVFSVERFAKVLEEHCKGKDSSYRLLFLIDEVGQYIGDNTDLMLDLQSIVERLGVVLRGRVWVVVTSQADVDTITKDQIKGTDFSKIQGRFGTRLPLSSANVDEVISKRILLKKRPCDDVLASFYVEKKTILGNLISFERSQEMKNYRSESDFVNVYPFIPYQFILLQKVFDHIRQSGFTGKHLAKGERSMLSAFNEAGGRHGEEEIGFLVPFSSFYNTIENFIDPIYKRTIDQAKDNSLLKIPEDVEVLKILFMIRRVNEVKATLDNLTVLSLTWVDQDKKALKESIAESLNRLEEQVLIHRTPDEYVFLTDDEQSIDKEIRSVDVEAHQIQEEVFTTIFNDIYSGTGYGVYPLNRIVDTREKRVTNADLTIRFLTPASHEYNWSSGQQSLQGENLGVISSEDTLLFLLPDNAEFIKKIRKYLQIAKYLTQNSSSSDEPEIQRIFFDKAHERDNLKGQASELIIKGIATAKVFVCGKEVRIDKSNPKDRIKEGLELLVKNVFSKKDYMKTHFDTTDSILRILKINDLEKYGLQHETNNLAREEVLNFIKMNSKRNVTVYLSTIKDHFKHKPYGWNDMDISGLVALLFIAEEVKLRYQKTYLMTHSPDDVASYLSKTVEANKLAVEIREKSAPDKIHAVQNIFREVFDKTAIPEKETDLLQYAKGIIKEELVFVEKIMGTYAEESRYPGASMISEYEQILRSIDDHSDPASFFDYIIEKKETLQDAHEKVEPVRSFFDSKQVDIFRMVLQNIERFKRNIQFLPEDSRKDIQTIEEIITLEEPYNRIKELSPLVNKIEQSLKEVLQQKKQSVLHELQRSIDELTEELQKYTSLSDEFKKELIKPFEEIRTVTNTATECALVEVQTTRINELRKETFQKIEEEKTRGSETKSSYNRKTKYLNDTELFRFHKIIENEDDLEEYIEELKVRLGKMLKEKNIKVL
jgi:hypothetical protein